MGWLTVVRVKESRIVFLVGAAQISFRFVLVLFLTSPVPAVRPLDSSISDLYFSWNLMTADLVFSPKYPLTSFSGYISTPWLARHFWSSWTSVPWEPSFKSLLNWKAGSFLLAFSLPFSVSLNPASSKLFCFFLVEFL